MVRRDAAKIPKSRRFQIPNECFANSPITIPNLYRSFIAVLSIGKEKRKEKRIMVLIGKTLCILQQRGEFLVSYRELNEYEAAD